MPSPTQSSNTFRLFVYFGPLTLLVFLVTPDNLLDIPTSYMLKDHLNASAGQVSIFRLLTGIPLYLSFAFGILRDRWNPFGWRDRGYFRLFVPLTVAALLFLALMPLTYHALLIGMLLAMIAFRFVMAAYQGLIALISQEALASGRLSTLSNVFNFIAMIISTLTAGYITDHFSPAQVFYLAVALTLPIAFFGFWKPAAVFNQAYENPHARGSDFLRDMARLVKHWPIYTALLINFVWWLMPGFNTPLQFHLTDHLKAPDSTYAYFMAIFYACNFPTLLLYGRLCTRVPLRKLLIWSTIVGAPQLIPLVFIHSGHMALIMAVPIGLMGGLANTAFLDLAMRSCPPGLQGTLMMMVGSGCLLALRGGDVVGSWIYGLSQTHGFDYCVLTTTVLYASILLIIPWIPAEVVSTADGEINPDAENALLAEIAI